MANEKIINSRIRLRYDLYSAWSTNNPVLLAGEVALAYIPTDTTLNDGVSVTGTTPPQVLMKVGDGKSHYNDLKYVSALAADVLNVCKDATALEKFVANVIADSGIASDEAMEALAGRVDALEKDHVTKQNLADVDAKFASYKTAEAQKVIDDEQDRRLGVIEDDYLKAADIAEFETKANVQKVVDDLAAYILANDAALAAEVKAREDALAGKQDVIPENTYDAYGSAAQALTDAKAYVDEEDKFVTDILTVDKFGGIAAGSDLNGMTTHEVLKKLLYPYVDATVGNATATPNGGTYEKGATKTITQVSISITKKSEPITSVALYNGSILIEEKTGDAVKNGGTITFTGLSVEVPTNGNQLTVKVTYPDANGNAKTVEKKTTALTFVYPYYMGSCAAGTAIDETLVESLTKKIEGKGNKSNSFTVSDGHMVFAYPKAHGVLKSILDPNNFETIGNYARSEVSVTGLDGTAQAYYVYVSGATTVSGFTVNFKY